MAPKFRANYSPPPSRYPTLQRTFPVQDMADGYADLSFRSPKSVRCKMFPPSGVGRCEAANLSLTTSTHCVVGSAFSTFCCCCCYIAVRASTREIFHAVFPFRMPRAILGRAVVLHHRNMLVSAYRIQCTVQAGTAPLSGVDVLSLM